MGTILTDTSTTALWHTLLKDAETRASANLEEDLESYLVFLLMRHQRDDALGQRVLALDWMSSLELQGQARIDALQAVGDRCLLLAGLYPEQANRRLVSLSYFLMMGQSAYDELAAGLKNTMSKLYHHLANAFVGLVRVLIEIRKLSGAWIGPDAFARHALCVANQSDAAAVQRDFPGSLVLRTAGTLQ